MTVRATQLNQKACEAGRIEVDPPHGCFEHRRKRAWAGIAQYTQGTVGFSLDGIA